MSTKITVELWGRLSSAEKSAFMRHEILNTELTLTQSQLKEALGKVKAWKTLAQQFARNTPYLLTVEGMTTHGVIVGAYNALAEKEGGK